MLLAKLLILFRPKIESTALFVTFWVQESAHQKGTLEVSKLQLEVSLFKPSGDGIYPGFLTDQVDSFTWARTDSCLGGYKTQLDPRGLGLCSFPFFIFLCHFPSKHDPYHLVSGSSALILDLYAIHKHRM